MKISSVGIVGYGHFGQFVITVVKRFLPGVEVRVHSRRSKADRETFFGLEETAASDIVVLCGSITGYEDQIESILPHLGDETVVVDVATVKKYTSELFKKHLAGRKWISSHPMFGAESYKKQNEDISGFRIVVTDKTITEHDFDKARNFLSGLGFVVIEMTADEHDKLLADTLFMTHYIGQTMQTAGFSRTNIDTVSFQSLMNAVESVTQDRQLFLDVYNHNPYCEAAAVRFHEAQTVVLEGLLKINK